LLLAALIGKAATWLASIALIDFMFAVLVWDGFVERDRANLGYSTKERGFMWKIVIPLFVVNTLVVFILSRFSELN
jgi:hypothetical protein